MVWIIEEHTLLIVVPWFLVIDTIVSGLVE